jgi:hypothetical protein
VEFNPDQPLDYLEKLAIKAPVQVAPVSLDPVA